MSKIGFFLRNATTIVVCLAANIIFIGCEKDDEKDDSPEIPVVMLAGKVQDRITIELVGNEVKNVSITIDFQANAGIKRIDITENGENFVGYPKTSEFNASTKHRSLLVTFSNHQLEKIFVAKVTDNKNRSASSQFTVSFVTK